jgi:dipeptidyl aminopeptidase/acylaminoacyl peptidase
MEVKTRIKLFTLSLSVSSLTPLLSIKGEVSLLSQLMFYVPMVLFNFLVVFFFYKGRNWARMLVFIGAVLGVFGFLLFFLQDDFIMRVVFLFDGILAVNLLWFLNLKSTKEYFQKGPNRAASRKRTIPLALKITVGITAALALIVGGIVFWITRLVRDIEHTAIWLEHIDTQETSPITIEGINTAPRFSPDSREIVFSHFSEIQVYSLVDDTTRTVLKDDCKNSHPSWGAGGNRIFYAAEQSGRKDIWVLDLSEGKKKRITDDTADENNPQVSPDGRWLLFTQKADSEIEEVYILPTKGGAKRPLTATKRFLFAPQDPSWSPDSQKIVYISFISLIVTDLEGKKLEEISLEGFSNISDPLFYPGNEDIILFKARWGQDILGGFHTYGVSRSALEATPMRKSSLLEMFYDISQDGKLMVYSSPVKRSSGNWNGALLWGSR